tara:strand:+ start:441 stop:737 length:297 start_codon:yes stop_codon:yes gene_type:complete
MSILTDLHDSTVILGKQPWDIRFVTRRQMPRKSCWGLCKWNDRTILVRRDLCAKNVLDTLLHEMRHGQHEIMFEAESFIDLTSTELAEGLIKTGVVKV